MIIVFSISIVDSMEEGLIGEIIVKKVDIMKQ